MQVLCIKFGDKSSKKCISRCSTWVLVISATFCAGVPQKHEQASVQENLSVQDSLSVNVVKADDVPVRAGEDLTFTVTLDKPPNFKGSGLLYQIAGPGGDMQTSLPLSPGQRDYKVTYTIPAAAQGGTWTVSIIGVSDGLDLHPFSPQPKGQTFQVIANRDLVLPTSASIVVNPSQRQLLRKAAGNLQLRIQDLKAAVASYQEANQQGKIPQVLRTNVNDALKALRATETEFKSKATAQGQADIAGVFFGDLRLNYDDVLRNLEHPSGDLSRPAGFVNAAFSGKNTLPFAVIVQASLRAFEGNELAYNIVAESGSLTFDLKVTSNPSGAAVSYYRRGDPPHLYSDPTNTVVPSLPYAVWYVKVEKTGYKAQEREHDAIHSADHVVNVELSPQR
jgi:hypothetical protein